MRNPKFVPGPWVADETFWLGSVNAGKRRIARANVLTSVSREKRVTRAEQLANARLMAAAPEMYELLCACLRHMENSREAGDLPGRMAALLDRVDGV